MEKPHISWREREVNRLQPEYNNSPRYYPADVPTYDARHLESKVPGQKPLSGGINNFTV